MNKVLIAINGAQLLSKGEQSKVIGGNSRHIACIEGESCKLIGSCCIKGVCVTFKPDTHGNYPVCELL